MEVIITAVITEIVTLLVCIINNRTQHSKTIALFDYKLGELTRTVEKHNNIIERTYELEKKMEVQEEKMRVANHRIDDLEKAGGT